MSSYNRVTLMGNLTRNPELRKTKTGTSVTELGLALNRVWSGENGEKQEDVTFVDVTLWGRNAENAAQYLQKGRAVLIEGRLQLETWQDKQSGQDRSKLKVVADAIQFLGGGQESGNSHSHSDHSEGREKDNRDERVEILEENDRGARRQSLPPAPSEQSYPNGSPDRRDS
ncbi:MAG TPA: single-stranded DNA-binding protein, partial [Verrucomicrobiales bacterium]|nr:single-stranded DNA-binding protein [Verrucomicrobiales bacterium]